MEQAPDMLGEGVYAGVGAGVLAVEADVADDDPGLLRERRVRLVARRGRDDDRNVAAELEIVRAMSSKMAGRPS